jgi:predicted RNase H-like HicB family nuclease
MRYAIVIEKGENSYGAYVPDLPGCFAVGETVEEVRELIKEAIIFHLEDIEQNSPPPKSVSICEYVEV